MSVVYVRWFDELSLADAGDVGGKCANLGELMRAGLHVPAGFALTTAAYARFVEHNTGDIPPDVLEAIRQAYVDLGQGDEVAVAVRSSAIGEDSPEASFAGQQETALWQRGWQNVAHHVLRCWASLYSPQAVAYRAHLANQAVDLPTMSVAIQRMVDARVAGVLFTLSPGTGDRSVIAINASWGLGVGVVGGEVTPDEYWVDKVALAIRRRTIVAKPMEWRPDPARGGIHAVAVPDDRCIVACLSDEEVLELARLGKLVEQHFGRPQDVEWAIAVGERFPENVYVVQSRPETVWSRRQPTPLATPSASPLDYVTRTMRGSR